MALVVDKDFNQELFEKVMAAKSANPIQHISIVPLIARNETGKIQRNLLT
jgi:acyl-coenzyme A synthetase/AMP-(fatty) acid ligase